MPRSGSNNLAACFGVKVRAEAEPQSTAALHEWLSEGPTVAVLEGFHGVGKTDSVIKLIQHVDVPAAHVRATSSGDLGLQDLLLNVAGELEINGNSLMADTLDKDLLVQLGAALRQSCFVVVDDFTELLSPETSLPPRAFIEFLSQLEKLPSATGRLLLVTDRRLSLTDDLDVRTIRLGPPSEEDAIQLLGKMLQMRRRQNEIPLNQRLDVVRWLGCNPRAFQALVACLEEESLDELIKAEQENWDLKNEVFSPTLIRELERRFRARTLSRLSPAGLLLAQFLSVYRRPFVAEGMRRFAERIGDIDSARRELLDLFLLDHAGRWFFLNPVTRELALARLQADPNHILDAHSLAADHYCRHFRAKGPINIATHAAEFVEARYHLTLSGRVDEFTEVASRYRSYLLANVHRFNAIPVDTAERTQLIATLTAALPEDQRGYPEARFILARLLDESLLPGNRVRALRQATLACRETTFTGVWVLRIRLSAQLESTTTMLSIVRQAAERLPENGMEHVYYAAAKALVDEGIRTTELITLVNDAMRRRATDSEAWMLFQLGAAILDREGRYDEAIDLLRGYLSGVGDEMKSVGRNRLMEQILLRSYGTQPRHTFLGLAPLADRFDFGPLFNCLQALLDGDFEAVCRYADQAPTSFLAVTTQAAFAELCLGYPYRAQKRLSSMPRNHGRVNYWLSSLIALGLGEMEVARTGLEAYLGRELRGDESLTFPTWIRVWYDTPSFTVSDAAFYIPRLPGELTGLDYVLVRPRDMDYSVDSTVLASLSDRPHRRSDDSEEIGDDVPDPVTLVPMDVTPRLINVINVSQEGSHVGDKNIVGQAAAVGSHASANNVTLQQIAGLTGVDMGVLGQELERLRVALREQPTSEENDEALAEVSRAARAAIQGDEAKVMSHLRASGQWALRTANVIGVSVAAAAIRHALGL